MEKDLVLDELFIECFKTGPRTKLSDALRKRLLGFTREERKEIVSRVKGGCAPLFVACKKGNVEISKFLIKHCDADLEQRGVYYDPGDGSEHSFTPLWYACMTGRLHVVRCLVEHGAKVNSVSDMGLGYTPVMWACFRTHYDIVKYLVENNADILKPNYNGATCLISSVHNLPLCEFLIKHGADVNAQDRELRTALHFAILKQGFETTKLLLESGADPFIKNNCGDDALQTACLYIKTDVFEYLCEKYCYPRERIAEAHELIGSIFLVKHENLLKCLYHWETALSIRHSDNPSERIPKTLVKNAPYASFVSEFTSFEELENLSMDIDAMKIQSLLVCDRILGSLHKHTIDGIMFQGVVYASSLQYQRWISLWSYALDLRIQKYSLLHSEVCTTAQGLTKLFLSFYEKHQTGMLHEQIEFKDIFELIRMLVCHFESSIYLLSIRPVFKTQLYNFDKILLVLTYQIYVLYVIPKTQEQVIMMNQLIRDILHLEPRTSFGDTLLHLVVSKSDLDVNTLCGDLNATIFPNAAITQLMLECGANVEAVNYNFSTPLHIAALRSNFSTEVVDILLKYGAHIDRRDGNGNHPHYMLQDVPECNVNHFQYTTLKCLAARKVVEKQIPLTGEVPEHLQDFIRFH